VGFFTTNPTKLGLYFSNFSTNFQSFSKSTLLFEIKFYRQAPGTFVSIADRSPIHEKDPGKNEGDTIGSLAMEAAAPAKIGRLRWRVWPGKDEELTGARFVLTDGVGRRSAAACGGGRQCLPLELLLRWRGGAGNASNGTGRRCGAG
jgi:hypothetical protein